MLGSNRHGPGADGLKNGVNVAWANSGVLQFVQQPTVRFSGESGDCSGVGGHTAGSGVHQNRLCRRPDQIAFKVDSQIVSPIEPFRIFLLIGRLCFRRHVGEGHGERQGSLVIVQGYDFHVANG